MRTRWIIHKMDMVHTYIYIYIYIIYIHCHFLYTDKGVRVPIHCFLNLLRNADNILYACIHALLKQSNKQLGIRSIKEIMGSASNVSVFVSLRSWQTIHHDGSFPSRPMYFSVRVSTLINACYPTWTDCEEKLSQVYNCRVQNSRSTVSKADMLPLKPHSVMAFYFKLFLWKKA